MAELFEVLQKNIIMEQSDKLFRLGTDSVLLADFAGKTARGAVCDLCAGAGAVGLLLCASNAKLRITGIELLSDACTLAHKNIAANALEERFSFIHGDIRNIRSLLPANCFDTVVCNPPYFPVNAGAEAKGAAFATARTEKFCTLENICDAASWLLRTKSSFFLVHRPERLADIIYSLRSRQLEPKELRFVRHAAGSPASIVLMKSVKGAKPGLSVLPELLLTDENGAFTKEYRTIYHMEDD